MKAIRSFTILHNDSDTKRIKINLEKVEGGYTWQDEDGNNIADEGNIYDTIDGALQVAKLLYNSEVWKMRSKW